jgi:arylsulfatase A-like enzyme
MAIYHQMVHGVDAAVGMIRAAVKEAGVTENTVFIFTSDNGFFCGSHGYGSKVLPYEESTNVPLIIFDPRHSSSGKKLRSSALTANIDMAPTILELAGLEVPAEMDGVSLLPLLDNPKAAVRDSATLINVWGPQAAHSYGVVTRDYKYVYWPYEAGELEPTEELYHLAKDPGELTNLAPLKGKELKQMRAVYDDAVESWKRDSVDYNGYEQYGAIFDRSIPWKTGQAKSGDDGKREKQKDRKKPRKK